MEIKTRYQSVLPPPKKTHKQKLERLHFSVMGERAFCPPEFLSLGCPVSAPSFGSDPIPAQHWTTIKYISAKPPFEMGRNIFPEFLKDH